MKKYLTLSLATVIISVVIVVSCSKEVTGRTDNITALTPADNDTAAGNSKMVLLKRPDTFAVATPAATNSPGYIRELNEVKGLQHNLTSAD